MWFTYVDYFFDYISLGDFSCRIVEFTSVGEGGLEWSPHHARVWLTSTNWRDHYYYVQKHCFWISCSSLVILVKIFPHKWTFSRKSWKVFYGTNSINKATFFLLYFLLLIILIFNSSWIYFLFDVSLLQFLWQVLIFFC